MKTNTSHLKGSTLIVVLTMTVGLSILATSVLSIISQTQMSGYRFVPFSQALFTAEAGADLAWSEVNKATMIDPGGSLFSDSNMWTKTVTASNTVWTLTSNGLYSLFLGQEGVSLYSVTATTPQTAAPYTNTFIIESTGSVNAAPRMGQSEVTRQVRLYLEPQISPVVNLIGLFGKIGVINSGNSGTIMSYNSQDGLVLPGQTNLYRHYGDVGSLSTFTNAVAAGNMNVYGSVQTGPGGTVGTNNNFNMYSGSGRSNNISDSLVTTIADVTLPSGFSAPTLIADNSITGAGGSTNYYKMSSGQSISGLTITGSGVVKIWAPDGITMNGGSAGITISPSFTISTNAVTTTYSTNTFKVKGKWVTQYVTNTTVSGSTNYNDLKVEFYLEDEMTIAGNGVVNIEGRPQNAYFYGLPTLTSVDIGGNPKFVGVIYAPQADLQIRGTADFYGSALANQITLRGNYFVGIDESLFGQDGAMTIPTLYELSKWEEVR